MAELTHLDEHGRARMVDVGDKPDSIRIAIASAAVLTRPEVITAVRDGAVAKGDVLAVARVAGIMAGICVIGVPVKFEDLTLDTVTVDLSLGEDRVTVRAEARSFGPTGVEMEALTAASVAALTIYDMCKALDRRMTITDIRLEEKDGGRSGHFRREDSGGTGDGDDR